MTERRKVLIVGGVAGGASCAARLRRLSEEAEIVLIDRGPFVSFANCGLPYYVGNVIKEEGDLLVATPEMFRKNFRIEVRTHTEATRIDRERREVEVREAGTGRVYREGYDALVVATGAVVVRPACEGTELPGIHILRTIPDSKRIKEWIAQRQPRRAIVVGGGFIGLEMVENLVELGLKVTVLEMQRQLMPPLDAEMAAVIVEHLESKRVRVELDDGVAGFDEAEGRRVAVKTVSGKRHEAGLVILATGVKPEATLARAAGLEMGDLGGIRVNEEMRTSDERIWAVGDVVEAMDFVTGRPCLAPLAGPANRQGRIAAASICGRKAAFRGVQGTAICGCLGLTVAMTGASEKRLKAAGITDYEMVYLHPGSHSSYYPGARRIHMKLIFSRDGGRVLGAQAVGLSGVDKRIDVISMAIERGATVFDLEEAELCYAPQYGAAKDPVNLAGMVAANVLRGDLELADWGQLEETDALLLDVRDPKEFLGDHIDGAVNIPLGELRERYGELPREREIWVNCAIGQRSYYAARFLAQQGYRVKELSGGIITYWGHYA